MNTRSKSGTVISPPRPGQVISTPNEMSHASFYTFYNLKHHIGSGGYGMVWACEDKRKPGQMSAVKIISETKCKRKTYCPTRACHVPDEVALWMPLSHPLILNLQDVFYERNSKHWYLVTDYDPDSYDLFHFVEVNGPFSSKDSSHIVSQIIEAVYYLANQGVDHRDIKDENILYNPKTKKIKLIDFGSASVLTTDSYRSFQGTDVYLPPEYFHSKCYDPFPASVWSIGCLAYVLFNGDCPFDTRKDVEQFTRLRWKRDKYTMDRPGVDFIEMCLELDVNRRIDLGSLIHHPWINMYDS